MKRKVQKKEKTVQLTKKLEFKDHKHYRNQAKYRRRSNLFRKSHELSQLTGCEVFLYIKDEFSKVNYWGTDEALGIFRPLVDSLTIDDKKPVASVKFVTPSKTPKHLMSTIPHDPDSADLDTLLSQLATGNVSVTSSDIMPLSTPNGPAHSSRNSTPRTPRISTPKSSRSSPKASRISTPKSIHTSTPQTSHFSTPTNSRISTPKSSHSLTPKSPCYTTSCILTQISPQRFYRKTPLMSSTNKCKSNTIHCTPRQVVQGAPTSSSQSPHARPTAKRRLAPGTPDSTHRNQCIPLPVSPSSARSSMQSPSPTHQALRPSITETGIEALQQHIATSSTSGHPPLSPSSSESAVQLKSSETTEIKEVCQNADDAKKPAGKQKRKKKDIYIVEAIEDKRSVDGEIQYYVKWKTWPRKYNTWEPEHHILDKRLITVYDEKKQNERDQRPLSELKNK